MKHIFQSWDTFSSEIKAASHILLLSDYDGTLTPIVGRPVDAVLSPETRDELKQMSERPDFSVGIISGRSLPDIKMMVGLNGIYYAGNHGLEIEGPDLNFVSPSARAAQTQIKVLSGQLSARLGNIEGVIIEDKGLSLSVHYRLVKEGEEKTIAEIFRWITTPWLNEGKIRVTSGKKVWEVRPPIGWNKGKAVETISQKIKQSLAIEQPLTLYLGDDVTDEDAFKVLHYPKGWSVFVGPENPSSNAGYFLNSTSEVLTFLSRLREIR